MSFHTNVHNVISNVTRDLDRYEEIFGYTITTLIERTRQKLASYQEVFELSNPYKLLEKGYSITRSSQGKIVTLASQLNVNDSITTEFKDGSVESDVTSTLIHL